MIITLKFSRHLCNRTKISWLFMVRNMILVLLGVEHPTNFFLTVYNVIPLRVSKITPISFNVTARITHITVPQGSASSQTKTKKRSDQGFPMVATFSTSAISALPIDGHQTSPAPPLLTADQPVRMYQAFPSLKLFAWWRICFFGHQHFQRIDRVIAANFLLMPIDGRQTWAVPPWPTAH